VNEGFPRRRMLYREHGILSMVSVSLSGFSMISQFIGYLSMNDSQSLNQVLRDTETTESPGPISRHDPLGAERTLLSQSISLIVVVVVYIGSS